MPEASDAVRPPARALVTSALPYANGHVHIGHLAGAYLPADVYVRFLRAWGSEVAFICGSDEHGVPTTLTAEKEGVTPREVIDRYHAANAEAFRSARVGFDVYHRTSDPRHVGETQFFFRRLHERGHIEKRRTEQLYCPSCDRFLPDRYVEGTCPHCGAGEARGDQCDACGHLVDALKLGEPKCKICGAAPDVRGTTHWFLKLQDFAGDLRRWLEGKRDWRANVRNTALGWIEEGLRARPITRDLAWGVRVPEDVVPPEETEGKVIYVWFDAPIGYLTFTKQWAEEAGSAERWREFWLDPATPIVHFIGKDNIPFHAITWPAMVMGVRDAELPLELPSVVVANEYLNLGESKFSKSAGRVIRISDFVRAFGADALRYYVAAVMPESSDSTFTWEDFRARYGELADVLGNFCHRGLSFAKKRLGGTFPEASDLAAADAALLEEIARARDEVAGEFTRFRFRAALGRIMDLARAGNRHFDERKPWETRKTDPADCARAIAASLAVARALAVLMAPFLPDAAARLAKSLGRAAPGTGAGSWQSIGEGELPFGAGLGEPEVLFPKLDDDEFAGRVGSVG